MNAIFSEQTCQLLGWTMLHFLWLGTALLLVAAVVRLALCHTGANLRYVHSLATLLVLAVLPIATAVWLSVSLPPTATEPAIATIESLPIATPQIIELNPNYMPILGAELSSPSPGGEGGAQFANSPINSWPASSPNSGIASGSLDQVLTYIQLAVPYLPYLWLLGTPITFALLATGLIGAERMRRHGKLIADGPVHEACERLRQSLRITRRVTLALCDRVAQPVLVGIVRPLILLPPAALAGWSPAELEMVLLHELAHVRRWDNLVNLAQRVIESLLFFHPAVWIVSTWVRRDREDCCDAVVVTRTAQPKQYAELLVALASPQPLVGLALARHPLAGRLRRILKLEDEPMLVSRNTIGLLTLAVVAIALVVVSGPLRVQGEDQPANETTAIDVANDKPADFVLFPSPLAGIAYPSPREGEIAQRAVDTLRLTLAPATEAELEVVRKHGHNSGLKIVSLSNEEDGVAILTKIDSIKIESFDDVQKALDQIKVPTEGKGVITWECVREKKGEFVGQTQSHGTDKQLKLDSKYDAPNQLGDPVALTLSNKRLPDGSRLFTTNPLVNIAYPSPREGEIALRAWKELKIKVAPATDEELGQTRAPDSELQDLPGVSHRGGLKLIDFNENFPNLEGTPILKELQCSAISTHISGFDDLAKALDAIAAKKPDTIILNGMIGGNRFNYSMAYPVTQPAPVVSPSSKTIARVYDIPRDTLNTPAAVELENWINAQKIQVMDDSPPDNRVIITATEVQHERIAEFLTDKPDDRIVKSHDIPKELRDSVGQWAETVRSIQGVWDDRGQFIMQAARSKHDELDQLVQGMEKWNDPEAAKDRLKNPVVKREENGQPVLEWRSAGLTLAGETLAKTFPQSSRNNMSGQTGVAVVSVEPGSPAAWRDIQPGDVLTSVGNFQTENVTELASVLESFLQGFERNKVLELIFYRGQSEPQGRGQLRAQSRSLPLRAEDITRPDEAVQTAPVKNVTEEPRQSNTQPPTDEAATEDSKRREESFRRLREQGALIEGSGVNSDAGLIGQIVLTQTPPLASAEDLEALRDYVKVIEEQYKLIDSLHRQGVKGGEANKRYLAAYELYLAQGELALAEDNRQEAHLKFEMALEASHRAFEAATEAYKQGIVSYDFLLQAIKNKAEIRRKIIQLKEGKQVLPPGAMPGEAVNSNPGTPGRMVYESTADGTVTGRMVYPQPVPAIGPPWPAPSTPTPPSNQPQPAKQPAPANLPSWPATTPPTSNAEPQNLPSVTLADPPAPFTPSIRIPQSEIRNSVYRYDGKTFQTWRDTWKHELSTEKRIEAVKALAAFGRAGYAKEAAETILDVAGEYDFGTYTSSKSPTKGLRDAIVLSFTGTEPHISDSVWFPMFMERFEKQPEKWQGLLGDILRTNGSVDAKFSEQIQPLAKHSIANVRSAALTWMLYKDPKAFDAKVKEALGDTDPQVVQDALRLLSTQQHRLATEAYNRNESVSPPIDQDVLRPVLFHSDPVIQKAARTTLKSLSPYFGADMASVLVDITANKMFLDDHLPAIRALAAIGENAKNAVPQLLSILRESDDLEIRVAAAVAIDHIVPSSHRGTKVLTSEKPLPNEEGRKLNDLIEEEKRQIVK